MNTTDELRKFADDCHRMALSTNDPKWDDLAERWLRRADSSGSDRDSHRARAKIKTPA
jgi:hypothetical protein